MNSAAVRRLQQKTQVFPLESNAAVRSRLTHSLEVQQVGRYISKIILKELTKQGIDLSEIRSTVLVLSRYHVYYMISVTHHLGILAKKLLIYGRRLFLLN
ncbi:hypothetical protein [Vibrio anguillarum]|uniref:hypothetical protein n=1 Tax=Vibrio anguillarum TaxID=55601 RepID=UPI00191BF824|nr:hypothetical protein [Vibrio anguillarum]